MPFIICEIHPLILFTTFFKTIIRSLFQLKAINSIMIQDLIVSLWQTVPRRECQDKLYASGPYETFHA